jgi:hypothetical protein
MSFIGLLLFVAIAQTDVLTRDAGDAAGRVSSRTSHFPVLAYRSLYCRVASCAANN